MLKALMLKIKDNREFLTPEKNLKSLIEYAETFHAQIFLVKVVHGKTLELKKLASAICDQEYHQDIGFETIEQIFPNGKTKKNRKTILKAAAKVKSYIRKELLKGKPISLKQLKERYKELSITDACLCNHLTNTRKELIGEGHQVIKVGAGTYCLNK